MSEEIVYTSKSAWNVSRAPCVVPTCRARQNQWFLDTTLRSPTITAMMGRFSKSTRRRSTMWWLRRRVDCLGPMEARWRRATYPQGMVD